MSSSTIAAKKITHPYIECIKDVCGGEPKIVGTRISVSLIADLYNKGFHIDEILSKYPHLTHSQVFDALSYYYDNKVEVEQYIIEHSSDTIKNKYKDAAWLK